MKNVIKHILMIATMVILTGTVYAKPNNELPTSINHTNTVMATGTIEVSFSPEGGCEKAAIEEIDKATTTICVQAYSFTNKNIGKALVRAANRGVIVKVIADKSQEQHKYSLCDMMANNNIPIKIDHDFAIAHSKIMIIDNAAVITGSYNFSSGAEHRNAENMLVLKGDQALTDLYLKNFNWRWQYADDYKGN